MTISTWLRIGVSCILLAAILSGVWSGTVWDTSGFIRLGLAWSGPLFVLAATELESLPSGCRVPRSRRLAALAAPWFPGGGRGALFLLLHLACVYGAMHLLGVVWDERIKVFQMGVTCLFAASFVLLPCAAAARLPGRPWRRNLLRLRIPAFLVGSVGLGGDLWHGPHDTWTSWVSQITNPWSLGEMITWDGRYVGHPASMPTLIGLTSLAILGNTRRMVRGVQEVVRAGRRTR